MRQSVVGIPGFLLVGWLCAANAGPHEPPKPGESAYHETDSARESRLKDEERTRQYQFEIDRPTRIWDDLINLSVPVSVASDQGTSGTVLTPHNDNLSFSVSFDLEKEGRKTFTVEQLIALCKTHGLPDPRSRLDGLALLGGIAGAVPPFDARTRIVSYDAKSHKLRISPGSTAASISDEFSYPDQVYEHGREMRELMRHTERVLLSGDAIPEPFSGDIRTSVKTVELRSRSSSNKTWAEINSAYSMADERLNAHPYEIQNALPYETGVSLGSQLNHMGLANPLHFFAWRKLSNSLAIRTSMNGAHRATKQKFIDSLQSGDKNVLILIAHNAYNIVFFPDGGYLTFAEIANLKRSVTPNRAIILVTCEAGGNQGMTLTLAETMIANRLAATVFASTATVDAEWVPELMDSLTGDKTIREAMNFATFNQLVENDDETAVKSW